MLLFHPCRSELRQASARHALKNAAGFKFRGVRMLHLSRLY
ncbi:hypothetical protein RHECNPAF_4300112 [Rhizobium etli CNPAF512]|nr:hypothetical protein RHECNPAF_4300112 [Rhizobium etli CNPAF512]